MAISKTPINQHKQIAMGKKLTGMAKGGYAKKGTKSQSGKKC